MPGLLLLVFAIGLPRPLERHRSARIGSVLVAVAGVGVFFTGFFRLDCRQIDPGCEDSSWHAVAHNTVAGLTILALVLAPFVLARVLKLRLRWRDLWVPTLAFGIGTIVAAVAGSAVGEGLGSLLAVLVWFIWIAVLAILHEARHTFASLMIAAGVNARALCSYMGHASVTITYDRYGHLMPGNEDEAATLLDAYLERANTRARLAAQVSRRPAWLGGKAEGEGFEPSTGLTTRNGFRDRYEGADLQDFSCSCATVCASQPPCMQPRLGAWIAPRRARVRGCLVRARAPGPCRPGLSKPAPFQRRRYGFGRRIPFCAITSRSRSG